MPGMGSSGRVTGQEEATVPVDVRLSRAALPVLSGPTRSSRELAVAARVARKAASFSPLANMFLNAGYCMFDVKAG